MDTQDKKSQNKPTGTESTDWKLKINDLVSTCQTELKKTTKSGMKMISASQSNAQLHESYEAIGKWLVSEVHAGKITVEDVNIQEMIAKVKELEDQLKDIEQDVQDIKES
jgi:hypothetical protein